MWYDYYLLGRNAGKIDQVAFLMLAVDEDCATTTIESPNAFDFISMPHQTLGSTHIVGCGDESDIGSFQDMRPKVERHVRDSREMQDASTRFSGEANRPNRVYH